MRSFSLSLTNVNLAETRDGQILVTFEITMVLGDRDLLLILAFFTIVMYGESRGN